MDELLENFPTDQQIKHLHKNPRLREKSSKRECEIKKILERDFKPIKSCSITVGPPITLPDGLRSPTVASFPFHPRGPIPARRGHAVLYNSMNAMKLGDDINEVIICHESRVFHDGLESPTVPTFPSHAFGDLAESAAPVSPRFPPQVFDPYQLERTGAQSSLPLLITNQSSQSHASANDQCHGTLQHTSSGSLTPKDLSTSSALDSQNSKSKIDWTSIRLNPYKQYIFGGFPQTMSGHWSIMSQKQTGSKHLPQRLRPLDPQRIKEQIANAADKIVEHDHSSRPPTCKPQQLNEEDLWLDDAGQLFRITLPGLRGTTYNESSGPSGITYCDLIFLVGMQNLLRQATIYLVMFKLSWMRARVLNQGQNGWRRDPRAWRRKAVAVLSKVSRETNRLSTNLEVVSEHESHRQFLLLLIKLVDGVTRLSQAIDRCIDRDLPLDPSLGNRSVAPWQDWCGEKGPIPNAIPIAQGEVRGLSLVGNQFIPTQGLAILEYWRRQQNEIVDKISRVALHPSDVEWQRLDVNMFIASVSRARGDVKVKRSIMPMQRTLGAGFPDRNQDDRRDVSAMARFFAQLENGLGIRMPLIGLYQRIYMYPSYANAWRRILEHAGDPEVLEWF